jgi:hypothetical protein
VHAGGAAAQTSNKMFDAVQELSIPFDDMGLDSGSATLPRVAHAIDAPLNSEPAGLATLGVVLDAARVAWNRAGPSQAKESGWSNLGDFLAASVS